MSLAGLIRPFLWLGLALPLLCSAQDPAERFDIDGVERIVAIGDLHGDYDNYLKALEEAELVDAKHRWAGGNAHLVQLGDIPSRGPHAVKIMRHIKRLSDEARAAGGRVHVLIGNHEAMNMRGDLRYVHPNTYRVLKRPNTKELRQHHLKRTIAARRAQDPKYRMSNAERNAWKSAHPLGYVEHRLAWLPDGEFGSWLLERPAVLRINRTLFVHGGLSASFVDYSLEDLNTRVHQELAMDPTPTPLPLVEDESGPLWYRGYAYPTAKRESISREDLELILRHFDVDRVVVGHTPGFGTVMPRFDGQIILADSGISSVYGGHIAVVEITNESISLRQRGQVIAIPDSDARLPDYLARVSSAMGNPTENLVRLINTLQTQHHKD